MHNYATEQDIQNLIRLELSKHGKCFRVNVGSIRLPDGRYFQTGLPPGFSDLIFIKEGRISFIEVKKKGGRASKKQLDFIDIMQKEGCRAGIAYSVEDALKICGLV